MKILLFFPISAFLTSSKIYDWSDLFKGSGGAERVAFNHADFLSRAHDVNIILFGNLPGSFRLGKIKIHSIPITSNWKSVQMIFSYSKIKNKIEQINPDIIHIHSLSHISYPAKSSNIPKVLTFHNSDGDYLPQKNIISYLRQCFRRYTVSNFVENTQLITTTSKRMRSFYNSYLERECEIIPNGINLDHFYTLSNSMKNDKQILFVGKKEKGLSEIVKLASKLPEYQIHIVGPISEEDIHSTKYAFNIENITIRGVLKTEELNKVYNQSSFSIFPSKFDNFPMVGLEAMSCSSIVISGHRGFSEYINGNNGITIKNITASKIVKVIRYLEKRPLLQRFLVKNAKKTASKYRLDNIYLGYESLYKKLHLS